MTNGSWRDSEDAVADVDWLPDLQRAASPWWQPLRDMAAPAPVSYWAARVTTVRVQSYDQIRVVATRGLLLVGVAVFLLGAPGASWLTWVLLVPGALQVLLEFATDAQLRTQKRSRLRIFRAVARATERAHAETLINITGVIGTVAVPANIVAVAYGSGPGEPSWVKVLALALAAAYGVSAILSFLTDATHYSAQHPRTKPYRLFRALRPYVWLITCVLMALLIAGSVMAGRWAGAMEPLAWALCALPGVIGMKQRDYERFLRASSEQLPEVQRSAKLTLCKDYHNTNTSIRVFTREVANDKSVPAEIRVKAAALSPLISLMHEAVDHDRWVSQNRRASLAGIAAKCASDASLRADIDLDLDGLETTNYELARALVTALLTNVGQAMTRDLGERTARGAKPREPRVTVTGAIVDGEVRLAVRDPLPLIAEWCHEGSTTLSLHRELVDHGGIGLSQHPVDDADPNAGKEIRASWPLNRPPLKLRDVTT